TFAVPGGYFGKAQRSVHTVDFFLKDGVQITGYLEKYKRPIIAFAPGRVQIFGSKDSFNKVHSKEPFQYALAGDSVAREKTRKCWRSIIATDSAGNVHFFVMKGTHNTCIQRLKN